MTGVRAGAVPIRRLVPVVLLLGFGLSACRSLSPGDRGPLSRHELSGLASWYGPGFEGKATASGELLDGSLVTAAHRTLPFGTMVRVTAADGRSVDVKVNDRGPFVAGRVIDLSRTAGEAIGLDRAGILGVTLTVLRLGDGARTRPAPRDEPDIPWFVQAGAFESHANALALSARLESAGLGEVAVEERAGIYRVFVGPHPTRRTAEAALARLPGLGLQGILARRNP